MKKLLVIFFIMFCSNITCFATETVNNEITKDFELQGYVSVNKVVSYSVNLEDEQFTINATDYNLPSNLYDFRDDIRLRITYKTNDKTIITCEVLNYKTGEIIQDVSEENIDKLFNIEYGKTVMDRTWTDTIKLSELKENEIYKYTANSTLQFPEITNDVGNCLIYVKEKLDETYEKEINMYKRISGLAGSVSFNEYKSGDSFNIMYKKIDNDELIKLIDTDQIIYLNNYGDGDALEYEFEDYIYNNTDKNIIINIKDNMMGVDAQDSFVMDPNTIYGFDWMIESATIAYSSQENNNEQKDETTIENSQNNNANSNNDNVEKEETNQSAKNSCKIVDGEYYGKDGNKTTELNYEKECLVKNPHTGNSIPFMFWILMTIISLFGIKQYKSKNNLKKI